MAKKFRDELERRAFRAMLSHAFFRWESAFAIALTIILVFLLSKPFPWWQWWYWLILGVVAEALIIWTSLSDVETGQKVVAEMFRQEFDVRALRDKKLRGQLEKAPEYRQHIEQYRQWQRERDQIFAMIDEVQQRTRQVPVEELEADIEAAVDAAKAMEMSELSSEQGKVPT